MRINLHDYSGHPFQAQLARELAARGHEVVHTHAAQYETGHGQLKRLPGDPDGLEFESITADAPLIKYSPLRRTRFELSYAKAWRKRLATQDFDLVIACNIPLFALARMQPYFRRRQMPWMLWHQDIYSLGVAGEASRQLPGALARVVKDYAQHLEKNQVSHARTVVAIGDEFVRQYERWGLDTEHSHVIPNWAPLDELVPGARDNEWSRSQNLPTGPVRLLYAGTLGRKHNPALLVELLDDARARGVDAFLTVISEGVGADQLKGMCAGRSDVRILGYQDADHFSDVLASADILIALLEPDAANFSVPSKVLSYLSAGRPIIAMVPEGNPAALDVLEAGGCVAPPTSAGAVDAAGWLAGIKSDRAALQMLGRRSRALAERRFDIETIGDEFEEILLKAVGHSAPLRRTARIAPHAERAAEVDLDEAVS
jgi:glycosyltransferase involved in cell wall biosynthesis